MSTINGAADHVIRILGPSVVFVSDGSLRSPCGPMHITLRKVPGNELCLMIAMWLV